MLFSLKNKFSQKVNFPQLKFSCGNKYLFTCSPQNLISLEAVRLASLCIIKEALQRCPLL